LLGAYANVENTQKILDIGTGTGLIALMLAQRSNAKITAIEIEKQASVQAKENVKQSKFKNQIEVINTSLQEYVKNTDFDLIVSNPPYFQNSFKAETNERTTARHTTELTYNELINKSEKLLAEKGKIYIIIPKYEEQKRVIITFSKNESLLKQSELIIENNGRHNYSQRYIDLTKEFYLKF